MLLLTHDHGSYFHYQGVDLYFKISGNLNGKTLLLLHSGLGCMTDFKSVYDNIPPSYKILLVDLRGHGKSSLGNVVLSYQQYQEDIEALLNYLNISRIAIFGISDGGILGYRLAVSKKITVTKLITLGSQWRLLNDDPSYKLLRGVTAEGWQSMFPLAVQYYRHVNPEQNFDNLVESVKVLWLDTSSTGYPDKLVYNITCPTLIMRGDNDFLFSLQEAVNLVAMLENSSFLNIPFTEHEAHKEYPSVVGSVMSRFLSQPIT